MFLRILDVEVHQNGIIGFYTSNFVERLNTPIYGSTTLGPFNSVKISTRLITYSERLQIYHHLINLHDFFLFSFA